MYQIIEEINNSGKIIFFGLSHQEALNLLDEIKEDAKSSIYWSSDTPIITLHFSTKLPAFRVTIKGVEYHYKIVEDYFSEMAEIFRPEKLFKPKNEETYHFNLN